MIQIFLLSAFIALLVALVGTYIAMKIQSRSLVKLHVQHEAWQRAQEAQLRTWEVRQGSHALDIEKKLTSQVKQVQENWRTWEIRDQERIAAMAQEFEALMGKLNLEHELARLPHVDETPLPANGDDQRLHPFKDWRPPTFYGADLSERDLSHRYLVQADFREARLSSTNFYMADLRGACLAGADLTGADLTGADLSGADLRSAILKGANLLVTDMHNVVLNGADLRGARNLTADQAYSAVFDNRTLFDENADVTLPRIPSIRFTVYTESTPLVSFKSSQVVKQLESPQNTVEAASIITSPETTEKQPVVGESPLDASDMLPSVPTMHFEMSGPIDQPAIEDTISPEAISSDTFPDAIEEVSIEMVETIPRPAVTLNDRSGDSEAPAAEEMEIIPLQALAPADISSTPEESTEDETQVAQSASLPSSDVTDVPTWSYEDTFEPIMPEFSAPEEFVDQLQTADDAHWAISEEADFENEYSNGNSTPHSYDGTSTNGNSEQVPNLDEFTEQQVEDTHLMPPPSNGNSHGRTEKDPRSNTQGNRRTGGAGKANPRKGQNDRRRARAN